MLDIFIGATTDSGLVRTINEDSVLSGPGLAAVADGMGGHAAGDVASRIALNRLERLVNEHASLGPNDFLAAIDDANQDILDAAAGSEREGMGTTLSGVGVVSVGGSDHWMVFNVGDSRVYRFSDEALIQITADHSLVEELVATGELTREEARIDKRRNIVTRSLGTDPPPQADVWVFPPTQGERFLVCSDGLTLEMDDEQIAAVLRAEPEAQRAADALVSAAVTAGGRDNLSALVVNLISLPSTADEVSVDTAPRPKSSRLGDAL